MSFLLNLGIKIHGHVDYHFCSPSETFESSTTTEVLILYRPVTAKQKHSVAVIPLQNTT